MPPALAAVTAFAATPLGGFVVNMGLSIGASLLANAINPQNDNAPDAYSQHLSLQSGGNVPIQFPFGYAATAGQRIYLGTWGTSGKAPNAMLTQEMVLSFLPVGGRPVLVFKGKRCTIDWDATPTVQGYPVKEFTVDDDGEVSPSGTPHMWVRYLGGDQTTASSFMVGKFASHPDYPYSSDMIGRGLAKIIVTTLVNRELFSGGLDLLFETDGINFYNPAKDSSVGGSGLHRWSNPATWEPSDNPVVVAYNIGRGIFYEGTWVYGGHNKKPVSAYRFPVSNWIAGINACNTLISLSGGGTQKQFRAGGVITGDMQPIDVMRELLKSANGEIVENGGIYKVRVGAPAAAVYGFTDANIVISQAQDYEPFPPIDGIHNAIEATYREPSEAWGTKDAPGRYNEDWEQEDGGRQLVAKVDFPYVTEVLQVQRLGKALVRNGRRFRIHVLTLPPDAWALEAGIDAVTWTSLRNGYVNKKFLVTSATKLSNGNTRLALLEDDPSDYDWVPANDQMPVSIGTLPIQRPLAQVVLGFSVEPAVVLDDFGNPRKPSIRVNYDHLQPDVRAVEWKARLKLGAVPFTEGTIIDLTVGSKILPPVFSANVEYEVAIKYQPYGRRRTRWSGWLPVTTPNILLGPLDIYFDVDLGEIVDRVAELNEWVTDGVRDTIDEAQRLARLAAEQDLSNFKSYETLNRSATAKFEASRAEFQETILAAVGPDGAVTLKLEELAAQVDDSLATAVNLLQTSIETINGKLVATANALTSISAGSDPNDLNTANIAMSVVAGPAGYSRVGVFLRRGGVGGFRQGGTFWDVPNSATGKVRMVNDVQQFVIMDTSTGATIQPFVFENNTLKLLAARIGTIVAGKLQRADGKMIVDLDNKRIRIVA